MASDKETGIQADAPFPTAATAVGPNGDVDVSIKRPAGFLEMLTRHPPGFWFIFWGEFAERCSYYGMRAILATYMVDALGFSQADSGTYVSLFIAACYLLPLLGGYLADNFFGKYQTIVWFSLPYILGHVILGYEDTIALFIALSLLAMGAGVIKPNISTLMGMTYDQQRPGEELLRSTAFSIFYMSINIGAAISQVAIPAIRTAHSYWLAFLFPAILMAVAFVVFAAGKRYYAKEVIVRRQTTPEERTLKWQILGRIAGLFLLVMFFWAVFDQSASTWIFYARTYMDNTVFGIEIDPEQVQALNPILIVALLPLVTMLWIVLERKGIRVRATDKMIAGFVLTAVTMAIMAYCGYMTGHVNEGEIFPEERKVSVLWQMLAYLALTIAEILISVTGLELAFVAAPNNMKSFVTSLWLLTVFLANLVLNVPLTRMYPYMHPGTYFAMLTVMMGVVTLIFFFVAQRFNRLVAAQAAIAQ